MAHVLPVGTFDVDVAGDPKGDVGAERVDLLDHLGGVGVLFRVENKAVVVRRPPKLHC